MTPTYYGPGQSDKVQNFQSKGIAPQLMRFSVETLAAGVDIAGRVLLQVPTGYTMTILQADLHSHGSPVGVDGSNTCAVAIKNGTNTAVSKTFNATTVFPAAEATATLTIASTYKTVAAAGYLTLYVTNGATANPPACTIQILVSLDQV